jgi:predicted esterase
MREAASRHTFSIFTAMKLQLAFVLLLSYSFGFGQRTVKAVTGPNGQHIGFYQYLPPQYQQPGKKFPLIIFLHGIGEKGTGREPDLFRLNCCGIPKYIDEGHTMTFTWNGVSESFVVLYPQLASKYGAWQNYYVDAMLEYAKKNLNIDTNRIFLTGLSLGGGGTWTYASASVKNAKKLTGIVPVVSPCFMTNGCNIANGGVSVLAVHVLDDVMASPFCTINAIKSINDCSPVNPPNLIMYQTGSHYVWIKRAYDVEYNYQNPNVYEWMLAQNRSLKPNQKPVARAGDDIRISASGGSTTLTAEGSHDPDGKITRLIWTKISGPAYGILAREMSDAPTLSGLTQPGVYKYQLKVVDDRAEWSTDTVNVTVLPATSGAIGK